MPSVIQSQDEDNQNNMKDSKLKSIKNHSIFYYKQL